MAKTMGRTVDLEPIDRLEEKVRQLVGMIERLRVHRRRWARRNSTPLWRQGERYQSAMPSLRHARWRRSWAMGQGELGTRRGTDAPLDEAERPHQRRIASIALHAQRITADTYAILGLSYI